MARQIIGIGAAPDDNNGDPLRTGMTKINDMTQEIYRTQSLVWFDSELIPSGLSGAISDPFGTWTDLLNNIVPSVADPFVVNVLPGTISDFSFTSNLSVVGVGFRTDSTITNTQSISTSYTGEISNLTFADTVTFTNPLAENSLVFNNTQFNDSLSFVSAVAPTAFVVFNDCIFISDVELQGPQVFMVACSVTGASTVSSAQLQPGDTTSLKGTNCAYGGTTSIVASGNTNVVATYIACEFSGAMSFSVLDTSTVTIRIDGVSFQSLLLAGTDFNVPGVTIERIYPASDDYSIVTSDTTLRNDEYSTYIDASGNPITVTLATNPLIGEGKKIWIEDNTNIIQIVSESPSFPLAPPTPIAESNVEGQWALNSDFADSFETGRDLTNEGSGGSFVPVVVNGNNVNGFDFEGTAVLVATASAYKGILGATTRSFTTWYASNSGAPVSDETLVSWGSNDSSGGIWWIAEFNGTTLQVNLKNAYKRWLYATLDAVNLFDGNMHHVALTMSGPSAQSIQLYIDGVFIDHDSQDTNPGMNTQAEFDFTLGAGIVNNNILNGVLYDSRLWDRQLTEEEVILVLNQDISGGITVQDLNGRVTVLEESIDETLALVAVNTLSFGFSDVSIYSTKGTPVDQGWIEQQNATITSVNDSVFGSSRDVYDYVSLGGGSGLNTPITMQDVQDIIAFGAEFGGVMKGLVGVTLSSVDTYSNFSLDIPVSVNPLNDIESNRIICFLQDIGGFYNILIRADAGDINYLTDVPANGWIDIKLRVLANPGAVSITDLRADLIVTGVVVLTDLDIMEGQGASTRVGCSHQVFLATQKARLSEFGVTIYTDESVVTLNDVEFAGFATTSITVPKGSRDYIIHLGADIQGRPIGNKFQITALNVGGLITLDNIGNPPAVLINGLNGLSILTQSISTVSAVNTEGGDNIWQATLPTFHSLRGFTFFEPAAGSIGFGVEEDDGTGAKVQVSGGLSVDGIELASDPINVIVVNSLADFPAPSAGVIELSGGQDIAYRIASKEVDVSPNVFSITGGNVFINGYHPGESELITDSTDPMFTTTNGSIRFNKLITDCPNGDLHSFSGDGSSSSLIMDNSLVRDCKNIALGITGAVAISLNRLTVLATTVGGFSFSGTSNSQLIVNNCGVGLESGFLGWTGNFLDLGTATFDVISINGNRVFPGAGDVFLTGAASGANIAAGGHAELAGNLFSGVGSSITTITAQDTDWLFTGNNFNDSVRNTMTSGDSFLTASRTVVISVAGTYVPINGTNWASDVLDNFTSDNEGTLTYVGPGADLSITAISTIEKDGGGADKLCGKLAIDSGSGFVLSDKTISCTDNATPGSISCQGLFSFSTGDKVQLWVANEDGTSDIIVSEANIIAKM